MTSEVELARDARRIRFRVSEGERSRIRDSVIIPGVLIFIPSLLTSFVSSVTGDPHFIAIPVSLTALSATYILAVEYVLRTVFLTEPDPDTTKVVEGRTV
jgi:hypothetical protein